MVYIISRYNFLPIASDHEYFILSLPGVNCGTITVLFCLASVSHQEKNGLISVTTNIRYIAPNYFLHIVHAMVSSM